MPKSTIVRCPRADTMRLLGLMSRCTTPISCAAASPEQACLAMRSTLSTGNIPSPLACRWRSMASMDMPSASSITMNSSLPTRPASRAEMMLGCLSRASVSASRRNLAMVSPTRTWSSMLASWTSLTATGWRVARSRPRQTSPMAPWPSGNSSSYRPTSVPATWNLTHPVKRGSAEGSIKDGLVAGGALYQHKRRS